MYKEKKVLAVITARGGSKGIPGKNIKPFSGKPLIAYTIEAANKSKYITRTIVSTDDDLNASQCLSLNHQMQSHDHTQGSNSYQLYKKKSYLSSIDISLTGSITHTKYWSFLSTTDVVGVNSLLDNIVKVKLQTINNVATIDVNFVKKLPADLENMKLS